MSASTTALAAVLAAVAALSFSCLVLPSEASCGKTVTVGGKTYMFNLYAAEGIVANFSSIGYDYALAVCLPLPSKIVAGCPLVPSLGAPMIVSRTSDGKCVAVEAAGKGGAWELITPSEPPVGVQQKFRGSDCDVDGVKVPRSTLIRYECDPDAGRLGEGRFVSSAVNASVCEFTFAVRTDTACPVISSEV